MKLTRRRTLILMLFPAILLIWMLGWSLYWIGNNQTNNQHATRKGTQSIYIKTDIIEEQINA